MLQLKVLGGSDVSDPSKITYHSPTEVPASTTRLNVLTDGFGRFHSYLRISLIEQCNLRCSYCMPEDGLDWTPAQQLLTDQEVIRLAKVFVNEGVTKIRLTGGEPLLRKSIINIVEEIGSLTGLKTLSITTNGLLLKRNLPRLQMAGLNLINISLDTLHQDRFQKLTKRDGLRQVLDAIDYALEIGYQPLKINCVVMRGVNEDEIVDFARLTLKRPLEVRFIEFMPFDGNRWDESQLVSYHEMLQMLREVFPLEEITYGKHETAKLYKIPGAIGQIGFITSMTDDFCAGCNRLRITADGHLKVCLFGQAEVNLRDAMRSGARDEDLRELIGSAVGAKHAKHAGMHNIASSENRPMITIGG